MRGVKKELGFERNSAGARFPEADFSVQVEFAVRSADFGRVPQCDYVGRAVAAVNQTVDSRDEFVITYVAIDHKFPARKN